jgi:isopenicillin-N epimerase
MTSRSRSDLSPHAPLPREGHAALAEFALAPGLIHLNHGSYGAVPRRVLAEQDRLRGAMERDLTSFFQDVYPTEIRRAADVAADAFGGAGADWVFCENATAAINAVLAAFPLEAGDEIVTTSHGYGAVLKAMQLWAARKQAVLKIADIPPAPENDSQILEGVTRAFNARSRLLVIDHITSPTAIVFPVEQIVRAAHAAGVAVLVDGAHAPGQIELDVPAIEADWYTGNAHKWFFAPRGCGILWTAPKWQDLTRPAVLSHGTDRGYTDAFDWIGTRDVSPWLCLGAAAQAFGAFGGPSLMRRNRGLAAEASQILLDALGGTIAAPVSSRLAMVSVSLPGLPGTAERALRLRQDLRAAGVIAPVSAFGGQLWLRVSAQIYNQKSDYERCAAALLRCASAGETTQ